MMQGEVQKVNFAGVKAGQQTFFIYLPEGYDSSNQAYSTLYHMHGAFLRLAHEAGRQAAQITQKGAKRTLVAHCPEHTNRAG